MKQISLQNNYYGKAESFSSRQANQGLESSDALRRVVQGDRSAIEECIDNYGSLIWSMAKQVAASREDAEAVTKEIFLNIWRYAARFEETNFDELLFITIVARRQLRKYSEKSNHSIN
jgi:RNA polymerase sigma-70 factor (ECF subfamily)